MNNLEMIKEILAEQLRIREREDKEVTVDYASVVAENYIDCINLILKRWKDDG